MDRNFKPDDAKLATGQSAGFRDDGLDADDGSSGTVRMKRTRGGRGFDPDTPTGTVRMTKLPGALGAGAWTGARSRLAAWGGRWRGRR